MNRWMSVCLVVQFLCYATDTIDLTIPVTSFTTAIHKQLYFIERLRETVKLLSLIDKKADQCSALIRTLAWEHNAFQSNFSHKKIKVSFKEIVRTQTLEPFFLLWDDVVLYKFLVDVTFKEEFVREVFLLIKSLLINTIEEDYLFRSYPHGVTLCNCLDTVIDLSPEQLVDVIALITKTCVDGCADIDILCEEMRAHLGLDMLKKEMEEVSNHHIGSQEILFRYYYAKRIQEYQTLVKSFGLAICCKFDSKLVIFDEQVTFCNSCIKQAIAKIESTHSVNSMTDLLDDCVHYKNVYSDEYARETLMVLFIALKNGIVHHYHKSVEDPELEKILELYENIDSLTEEDLLDAIDLVVGSFENIYVPEKSRFSWSHLTNLYQMICRIVKET